MKKILIVDDEVNNRLLLTEIFEEFEEGVEILLAEDGKQALDIIKSESPDLVF